MLHGPISGQEAGVVHTGIPELVLIPAPVTTMTLRAFSSESAMSWSCDCESGGTCVVGIVEEKNAQRVAWESSRDASSRLRGATGSSEGRDGVTRSQRSRIRSSS